MDRVVHVMPNRYHKLQTTKSWDFIGLPLTARRNLKMERDIIVGLFDTGSWIFYYIFLISILYICIILICFYFL
jgi:hypothetical protein